MLNFFREGLHYIHFAFFKTLTLKAETERLPKTEVIIIFLKTYAVVCILAMLLLAISAGASDVTGYVAGYTFDWYSAYKLLFLYQAFGLIFGLIFGLVGGLIFGLVGGLIFGLVGGLIFGLVGGLLGWPILVDVDYLTKALIGVIFTSLAYGWGFGHAFGLNYGLTLGLIILLALVPDRAEEYMALVLFLGFVSGIISGVAEGMVGGLLLMLFLGLLFGLNEGVIGIIYNIQVLIFTYFFFHFRSFYILPHVFQYWRSSRVRNPFSYFRHSPVYWDQMIRMPLPFLQDWLLDLVRCDPKQGLDQLFFVVNERPFQRKAAFRALLIIIGKYLENTQSVADLTQIAKMLVDFPADDKALPSSLQDARKYINVVSALAADYQIRQTRTGQLKVLAELHDRLTDFQKLMKLTVAPVGSTFEPLTIKWLHMVSNEQEKLRQQSTHNELPNPYIAGNPLEVRDQQLFVGRSDILLAIEQFILNTDQRPSLLLYGRRRTGKSSTLLNLPRSRFEPVYIDCQDAKWHESDQAFCYNLAHDLFNVLYQSDSVRGLRQPQIEQFDKNAFTQLDQFLTQAQKIAEQRDKRILLAFDEYEELENSIINGDISEKVLGKLRNLIQHSKSIVVLVSGSHRFEELTRLNWANYLINTRTLELSYLDAESARELLTKPVPELHYEAGVVDEIIHITHCQPYLLQAVASELVNYLNSKQQTTATPDDLNTALEKTLVSASAYFSDTWRKDNSEAEQQVMRALATGKTESVLADAAFQPAIQSLIRKEIVEGTEGSYRLAVELFARWIVRNQV